MLSRSATARRSQIRAPVMPKIWCLRPFSGRELAICFHCAVPALALRTPDVLPTVRNSENRKKTSLPAQRIGEQVLLASGCDKSALARSIQGVTDNGRRSRPEWIDAQRADETPGDFVDRWEAWYDRSLNGMAPGDYNLCWCRGCGQTAADGPLTGFEILVGSVRMEGPILGQALECLRGSQCVVRLEGVGLSTGETIRVVLDSCRTEGTAFKSSAKPRNPHHLYSIEGGRSGASESFDSKNSVLDP